MRYVRILYISGVLAMAAPAVATAQRVPDYGTVAAGAEGGLFFPDNEFEVSPIFGGLFEYYVSPRVGLRGSLLFAAPDFERGTDDELRQARLGFDVIYNWEYGKWHPFAGGGIGFHLLDLKENGRSLRDDTEVGLSVLGGAEYFFDRRTTFKIEGRFQFVDDVLFSDPSGFAATFGVKWYF